MKNRFGRRYITHKELLDYAKDLDLFTDHPPERLPAFLERHALLNPVARIRFPPEVVRRWHKERYPDADVPDPIEGDTPRLAAACALYDQVFNNLWSHPDLYGERSHPLDEIDPAHAAFVQTSFDPSSFVPWEEFRTAIQTDDGQEIYDGGIYSRTCYHYWHVFALAAFLRSGVTILYDLADEALWHELRELRISDGSRSKLWTTMNLEARHELRQIEEHASLFDAVAWFEAYRGNALQLHIHHVDRRTRRLPYDRARTYRRRCRELVREVVGRYGITPDQLLAFIKFQYELWCTAKTRSPPKLADEYARNVNSTIQLYREITRATHDEIVERVGRAGGYFKPILKVIFPDWLDEQRDLAERSLRGWILPSMASLPPPFTASDTDIVSFCDWLEEKGLLQLYWHFKRLADLGMGDGPIARSATAAEVVGYANTVELMANAIIENRGTPPRGRTLPVKVREIVSPAAPSLIPLLIQFKDLTRTETSTLRRRLAQIDRIRQGGSHDPVLRVLLKLIVIRNEGSHLGLSGFDRPAIYSLLESLVQASLLLWKVR